MHGWSPYAVDLYSSLYSEWQTSKKLKNVSNKNRIGSKVFKHVTFDVSNGFSGNVPVFSLWLRRSPCKFINSVCPFQF